jgi:hypothetical protein
MKELIPLALGIPLAFIAASVTRPQARWAVVAIGSVVLGVAVSATVGELEESWAFALLDIAQVLVATVAVMWLRTAASSGRLRSR